MPWTRMLQTTFTANASHRLFSRNKMNWTKSLAEKSMTLRIQRQLTRLHRFMTRDLSNFKTSSSKSRIRRRLRTSNLQTSMRISLQKIWRILENVFSLTNASSRLLTSGDRWPNVLKGSSWKLKKRRKADRHTRKMARIGWVNKNLPQSPNLLQSIKNTSSICIFRRRYLTNLCLKTTDKPLHSRGTTCYASPRYSTLRRSKPKKTSS